MNPSSSKAQQEAEKFILNEFNKELGLNLKSQKIQLTNKTSVQLDGFDEEEKIICEIYAHIGELKGCQPKKVASDFLKMLLVEETKNCQMEKYFIFANEEASKYVKGNSWLSHAVKIFDIKIRVIEPPKEEKELVEDAQIRQNLLNQKVNN